MLNSAPYFFFFLSFNFIIIVDVVCAVSIHILWLSSGAQGTTVMLGLVVLHGFWESNSGCQACTASA